MKDIYQLIWDADQAHNGIPAVLGHEIGSIDTGFVKVNTNLSEENPDLQVLTDLVIPESKMHTYKLALKLFDNYALPERDQEIETAEERAEVHDFISAIIDTPPMQIAREYIAQQSGSSLSRERWYNTIMEMWFRKYEMNGDPHLSGFEHVIIGEQDQSKVKGYHFWYKYYLDDGHAREQDGIYAGLFPDLTDDRIQYRESKLAAGQQQFPETVTMSYRWFAPDYDRQALRPLYKKIGGFFVGCSIEGLLALGTVRAHLGINAPKKAVINGAEYSLKLFHNHDRKHVRTFYPVFIRPVEQTVVPDSQSDNISETMPTIPPAVSHSIKIVAGLVNPQGNDVGLETITLINTSSDEYTLHNWSIMDKNDNRSSFSVPSFLAGETHRITLDGKGAQLSNKGGTIKLLNENNEMVHLVSYSREQVRNQGVTILF